MIVSATVLYGLPSIAQQQQPTVKLLSADECKLVERRNPSEFFVKGPLVIGSMEFTGSVVGRGSGLINGIDVFEVIERSCFKERAT